MIDDVQVKRIYESADPGDGARILVDRVWPRGVTKAAAQLDAWAKDLAPTTDVRKWYGHDRARFEEFRRRYEDQLDDPDHSAALARVSEQVPTGRLTLLTATREVDISAAAVLAEWIRARPRH